LPLALDRDSIVRERGLEIVDDGVRSIGRGDAFRILVGVGNAKRAAESKDFGFVG
jgi:hypothetical protein